MTEKFKKWTRRRFKMVKWNTLRTIQKALIYKNAIVIYEETLMSGKFKKTGSNFTSIRFKSFAIENIHEVNEDFCYYKFKGKVERLRRGC